jgi:hypothetical protein
MESLTSPKINDALHCMLLRSKRMYVSSVVAPDEATFYVPYEASAYWCADKRSGFGADGQPARRDVCRGGRGCCTV